MIFELKIDQTAFADPLGSLRLRNFQDPPGGFQGAASRHG